MRNKKLSFWQKTVALVLSFMLFVPTAAFAKESDVMTDVPKTEVVQIDVNAEIEKMLQEDETIEDTMLYDEEKSDSDAEQFAEKSKQEENGVSDIEENQEDADFQEGISPRGVPTPTTELIIQTVSGQVDGTKVEEVINCGKNKHIASNASAVAKTPFDKKEVTISVRYIGIFLNKQSKTATGDIYISESAPYNNVINGSGASTAFTIDYRLTPRDQNVEQTVFEFKYRPYYANGTDIYSEYYYRRLTINWGESVSDIPGPTSPYIIYNDPSSYAVLCGVDSSMEYKWTGDKVWTQCTADRIPLPSTTKNELQVRYRATGDTIFSQAQKIEFKQPGEMPHLTLSRYTGKITGLTDEMEMRYNYGAWEPISDEVFENGAASYMEKLSYGEKVWFEFRYKATTDTPASKSGGWYLLPFVVDAPSSVAYDPLSVTITGLNNTMEYGYNLTTWYDVGNYSALNYYSLVDYQVGKTMYVRTKATDEHPASMYKKLDLPGLTRPAPSGITVTYDSINDQYILHNLIGGQKYDYGITRHFGSGSYNFVAASNGDKVIRDDFAKNSDVVYLRLYRTETEGPSACVKIDLPKNVGEPIIPTSEIALSEIENTDEFPAVSIATLDVLDENNANGHDDIGELATEAVE